MQAHVLVEGDDLDVAAVHGEVRADLVEGEFEQSVEGVSIGGGLLLGAEVRLAKGVTLGGAYVVGVSYDQETLRVNLPERPNPEPQDRSTVRFDTGTTNLALSVTF